MSKDDQIEVEGIVEAMPGGGIYLVRLEGKDHKVKATLSGKMKTHKIKVTVGDRVKVALSPYDLTRGRLIYRTR